MAAVNSDIKFGKAYQDTGLLELPELPGLFNYAKVHQTSLLDLNIQVRKEKLSWIFIFNGIFFPFYIPLE